MKIDALAKRLYNAVERTKVEEARLKWENTNDTIKKQARAIARYVLRNFKSR